MQRRLAITNNSDRLMFVITEVEAQDYWLKPGESVEVRADIDSHEDDFEIEKTVDGVTVWPSRGMGYIATYQNGIEWCCGHQRPDGWA